MTAWSGRIATGIRAHQAAHAHLQRNLAECACRGVKLGCPDCLKNNPQATVPVQVVTSAPARQKASRDGMPGVLLAVDDGRGFWKSVNGCTAWVPLTDLQLEERAA